MTEQQKASIEEAAKLPTAERIEANSDWKLIGHSHQIADTGDYDGHYEITNGKISLLTQDDDDESLQPIVDALNDSGCKFYQDDWFEFENKMLKEDVAGLRERVKELEAWKQYAMAEAEKLDIQAIGSGLGCKIGTSIPEQVLPGIKKLKAENARYRDRIGEALKFLQSRQQTTPGLGAPVTILKQALEK